jgi:hypothetical protein
MTSISGDANNIQIGSGTNIQDNSLVHVAKSNLSGKVFPTIIGNNVTVGKCLKKYVFNHCSPVTSQDLITPELKTVNTIWHNLLCMAEPEHFKTQNTQKLTFPTLFGRS